MVGFLVLVVFVSLSWVCFAFACLWVSVVCLFVTLNCDWLFSCFGFGCWFWVSGCLAGGFLGFCACVLCLLHVDFQFVEFG